MDSKKNNQIPQKILKCPFGVIFSASSVEKLQLLLIQGHISLDLIDESLTFGSTGQQSNFSVNYTFATPWIDKIHGNWQGVSCETLLASFQEIPFNDREQTCILRDWIY